MSSNYDNIQVYPDTAGGWRFRVTAGNGEIIAQSEAYTRRADAERGGNALALSFAEKTVESFLLNELHEVTQLIKERKETDPDVARELVQVGDYLMIRIRKLHATGLADQK